MSWLRALAEGKVSSAVDVYVVYKALFLGERSEPSHEPYCDPKSFFSLTYVTPAFRTYLEGFLGKLSVGESEVYLMPALLGAGKSHFLALVLHVLALYKKCNGVGACVKRELEGFGVDLAPPDLKKAPNVYVFHGQYDLSPQAKRLRSIGDKGVLKKALESSSPVVLIFDETQYFEAKEADFPLWMQMLAEAVKDVPGAFLFVSFSLFPGERPELAAHKTQDAVRRVQPVNVSLDAVKNIVAVFRRWAGLSIRRVDLAPLKEAVDDKLLGEFEGKLRESYPFNPYLLDVVLRLADESLAERTRIQLTRELLRTLARAYLNADEGELVVFYHLPEPREMLLMGGPQAEYWQTLLRLYEEDVRKVGGQVGKSAVSVLRHVLLTTFLSRLIPAAGLYPTEDELVLGSFNGREIRPVDVRGFLQVAPQLGLHVEKPFGDRWMYWYIGDVTHAIADAMLKFGDNDGLEVATDEVVSVVKDRSAAFSKVVVSGPGGPKVFGKVRVASTSDGWTKELSDADSSALAIDLMDFGVTRRRNNLVVVRRADQEAVPQMATNVLSKLGIEPRGVKEAVVDLGRAVRAVDEVSSRLYDYFQDLLLEQDDRLRRNFEEILKSMLEQWRENARQALRLAVASWLKSAVVGFREEKDIRLDELLSKLAKEKREHKLGVVKALFEGGKVQWDGFKKLGDLWSLYLNNDEFPGAPLSFSEFLGAVQEHCSGCKCVFKADETVYWLARRSGCEMPQLDRDVEVWPLLVGGRLSEGAVEAFLKQLAVARGRRYAVVYRRPTGEEVRRFADEMLAHRGEWLYLTEGWIEVVEVKKDVAVLVDGVATPLVERRPGEEIRVVVEASDDLSYLSYSFAGVEEEVATSGRRHKFVVNAPQVPGEYKLVVSAKFRDGEEVGRVLSVVVKGKCKKSVTATRVSAGESVVRITTASVGDAADLVDYLVRRGVQFRLSVGASLRGDEETLELRGRWLVRDPTSRDKVVRLLKALQLTTSAAEAVVEFVQPFVVDEDAQQKFKGSNYMFEVEREAEC